MSSNTLTGTNPLLERRDALKFMGLGSAAIMMGGQSRLEAETKLSVPASHKHAKIVIAGGGTGGMIAAARLRRSAPNTEIILIAPNTTHLYQSGQVYAAAGIYTEYDNKRQTADLLPDGVTWLKEKVTQFDPEKSELTSSKSGKMGYDYLIVALGCEYDFSAIKGLSVSDIGKNGITSVYLNDQEKGESKGAIVSKMWFNQIREKAASTELKVLFAESDTAIKGENAPLDMLFLCQDMLKGNGPKKGSDRHAKVRFTLCKNSDTLFRVPETDKVLENTLKKAVMIDTHYKHTLKAVDVTAKKAKFETPDGQIEKSYDFLHVTPPMQAPKILSDSPLAFGEGPYKGWMQVDEKTLQHPKYPNVFGIGDILGLNTGKSGAAAREQGIVLQDNIAAHLEKQKLPMHYNGYSVAPIKTAYGEILLAEYTNKGLAPTLPFSLKKPQWIWWAIDVHVMRRAYFELMMRGMM